MTRVMIEDSYKESKVKKAIKIYFNEEKTSFQRIQPSESFGGDYLALVDHITKSDTRKGEKNYHSFDVE